MLLHLLSAEFCSKMSAMGMSPRQQVLTSTGSRQSGYRINSAKDTASVRAQQSTRVLWLSFSPRLCPSRQVQSEVGWDKKVFSNGKEQRFKSIFHFLGLHLLKKSVNTMSIYVSSINMNPYLYYSSKTFWFLWTNSVW